MDTECILSFADLGTHWTKVSLTGHMVHLYVIPQVGLVLGGKFAITAAPSACHRIFEDLSVNQGCKEKAFHAGVNTSDSQSDCSLAAIFAISIQF